MAPRPQNQQMQQPVPEGKEWWLELQRHRSEKAWRRPAVAAGSTMSDARQRGESDEPGGSPSSQLHPGGDVRTRRRSSLLQTSQALLQRLSRHHDNGLGSQPAAPAGLTLEPPPQRRQQQEQQLLEHASSCPVALPPGIRDAAAPSAAPLARTLSRLPARGGRSRRQDDTLTAPPGWMHSGAHAEDDEHLKQLLEGGLVGKAMAASAAWRAMRQQQAEWEQGEWQRGLQGGAVAAPDAPDGSNSSPGSQSHPIDCAHLEAVAEGVEAEEQAGSSVAEAAAAAAPTSGAFSQHPGTQVVDRAIAEFQLAAFADSEIRHHVAQLLGGGGSREAAKAAASPAAGSLAAAAASPPPVSPPTLAALASPLQPSASSAHQLVWHCSAEATAGGDAGHDVAYDPLLTAWMVTRSPPDIPVRGYAPPPGRTACRIIAAQEMAEYYRRQVRAAGCFFPHLGLTRVLAGGRGSDASPMQLLAEDEAREGGQRRKSSLRSAVRKTRMAGLMQEMAVQSKASVWAKEHVKQVTAAAEEQHRAQREAPAAAEPPAVQSPLPRRSQLRGGPAGDAFASVVQQALQGSIPARRQAGQGSISAGQQAGRGSISAVPSGESSSASGSRRGSALLPPVQLQKLTQRWQRNAEAAARAAGEQSARERRRVAAAKQLRQQWESVRRRLPGAGGSRGSKPATPKSAGRATSKQDSEAAQQVA